IVFIQAALIGRSNLRKISMKVMLICNLTPAREFLNIIKGNRLNEMTRHFRKPFIQVIVNCFISFTMNVKHNHHLRLTFHQGHDRTTMSFSLNSISFKVTKLVLVVRKIMVSLVNTPTEMPRLTTSFDIAIGVSLAFHRQLLDGKIVLSTSKHPIKCTHTTANCPFCSTNDRIRCPARFNLLIDVADLILG